MSLLLSINYKCKAQCKRTQHLLFANNSEQLPTMLVQHCWELLRPFARSLKVWPVSNFNWATTGNRMCKRTQHVTSNNVGSCWPTICVRLLGAYVFSFRRQNENGLKLRKLGHVTSSVGDKIGPLWPKTDYALFSLWQNHPIPFT